MTWHGTVSADGTTFVPDHPEAFREALAAYAGQPVQLRLAPPVTRQMRAFWHAVIVPAFCEATGEPSRLVGHYQLLHLLDWTPDGERPTTRQGATDAEEMGDRIARAIAYLAHEHGIVVPEPERDPWRRAGRRAVLALGGTR